MSTLYFGFAISDSMFNGDVKIARKDLGDNAEIVKDLIANKEYDHFVPCLNPSHTATIAAMQQRFNLEVTIPDFPPKVALSVGDGIVIMQVRGLPRLTDRREYTSEEIAEAVFGFSLWEVE